MGTGAERALSKENLTMTVAEAIKALKKYPKDAEIYLIKDWEQECDEYGCFKELYRLREITEQRVIVENGMDWDEETEVLFDFEEEIAKPRIEKGGL